MAYNSTRLVDDLLERYKGSSPSFLVHLYPEHWTLNHGSKFLYNNQIASLLDDIRAHRIPVDFLELFDSAHVPFYDGCMIVELLDYRSPTGKEPALEKPLSTRVVLHPSPETLWADLCLVNDRAGKKWTDLDVLGIESRIILATASPLCLAPNPQLVRIANSVLRVSTPTAPMSLKRKASEVDAEEDESDKIRRAKIIQFMNPRNQRQHSPNYRILDTLQQFRAQPHPETRNLSTSAAIESLFKSIAPTQSTVAAQRSQGAQTPSNASTAHLLQVHQTTTSSNLNPPPQPSQTPATNTIQESDNKTTVQSPQTNSQTQQNGNQALSQPSSVPGSQAPTPTPAFQPAVPGQQFLSQPPARNAAPKMPNTASPVLTARPQITPALQHYALQQQQQQPSVAGRVTPQHPNPHRAHSPLNPQQQSAAAVTSGIPRSSTFAPNQATNSYSPVLNQVPRANASPVQTVQHAAYQSQFTAPNLRPALPVVMPPGSAAHLQMPSHQQVQQQQRQQAQQQQQQQQQPQNIAGLQMAGHQQVQNRQQTTLTPQQQQQQQQQQAAAAQQLMNNYPHVAFYPQIPQTGGLNVGPYSGLPQGHIHPGYQWPRSIPTQQQMPSGMVTQGVPVPKIPPQR